LDAEQRRIEARKMELYAAMVENLDHHVGRLIDHLKARGVYDNTLIVFMSDNGAAGSEDFYYTGPFVEYVQAHYDNSYENMGQPDSWISYGPPWAEAGSAPFSRYKTYTLQGGIAAQIIIAGPGVAHQGAISRAYVTVMDLAPTFLEIGGATFPQGGSVRPMEGESMAALLAGKDSTVPQPTMSPPWFMPTARSSAVAAGRSRTWSRPSTSRPSSCSTSRPIPERPRTWRPPISTSTARCSSCGAPSGSASGSCCRGSTRPAAERTRSPLLDGPAIDG
jgi:hypothetical protein